MSVSLSPAADRDRNNEPADLTLKPTPPLTIAHGRRRVRNGDP